MPGPDGFPLAKFQPGAVAGPGYSPFIQIAGSDTVYNAPIIATGNGPYDVVTGVNPATGQPEPYGSVGVDINCAVIGFTNKAPTANLASPVPLSQFPPR